MSHWGPFVIIIRPGICKNKYPFWTTAHHSEITGKKSLYIKLYLQLTLSKASNKSRKQQRLYLKF